MKLELYCACGAIAEGVVEPDDAARRWLDAWRSVHSDDGCRACGKEQAMRAIRNSEIPLATAGGGVNGRWG